MIDQKLSGCRPAPLACYLKALGVLRLVAEQADPEAKGFWEGECFVLRSCLDEKALRCFFEADYAPTPIVTPWNGGGGFFFREGKTNQKDPKTGKLIKTGVRDQPTTATKAVDAVATSLAPRLAEYRDAIALCRQLLAAHQLIAAPSDEQKAFLVSLLRDEMPERAAAWLDAVLLISNEGLSYPPLLGTGGTEGNLDFASNFQQRLSEIMDFTTGDALSASPLWLRASLFAESVPGLLSTAIGQFYPSSAGGTNAGAGFSASPSVNPWDFLLMIEGSLFFSAAATRRIESSQPGTLSYPFSVRASGTGYASASLNDEAGSRHELWLPLWSAPAGLTELRAVFSEGRAKVGRRTAATGVDFARALTTLGTDRGIGAFTRYAFHVRNGLSYFAVPLGRWRVPHKRNRRVDLLSDRELDRWLERFRRSATGQRAPASLRRALHRLESAILALCQEGNADTTQDALVALGAAEEVLHRSLRYALKENLRPVPPLPLKWSFEADDNSPEFRLAASLAALGLREHLVAVRLEKPKTWLENDDGCTVWGEGDLVRNFCAVLKRRDLDGRDRAALKRQDSDGRDQDLPHPIRPATLEDISAFIDGTVDERRLEALLRGLSLINWKSATPNIFSSRKESLPPAAYQLLALAHHRRPRESVTLPHTPGLLARGFSGNCFAATNLAVRRLKGAGLLSKTKAIHEPVGRTRRITAALLFPLGRNDLDLIANSVLVPSTPEMEE